MHNAQRPGRRKRAIGASCASRLQQQETRMCNGAGEYLINGSTRHRARGTPPVNASVYRFAGFFVMSAELTHARLLSSSRRDKNKAIVDNRLRPRSGAAPWWFSLSIRRGGKSMILPNESPVRRLLWPLCA